MIQTAENTIELNNIVQNFGDKNVLNGINLKIAKGEIFALLGPSGAGKTTLIKIITGQLKQTGGEAKVLSCDTRKIVPEVYSRIGMMLDNSGVYERLSCYDNMKIFARIYKTDPKKIDEALSMVGLLKDKKKAAGNLSKGMKSRLMLARAILNKPEILFLDEPTSGLDPVTTGEIHKLINQARDEGTTIFLTTHNMEEASKLCDHVALLNEGAIVEYGVPDEICRKYNKRQMLLLHLKDGTNVEMYNEKSSGTLLCQYIENGMIESIHSTEPSLETVFIELTGRDLSNKEEGYYAESY